MTLPSILVPDGLPLFLANGHQLDRFDVFGTVERGTGHTRRRRLKTSAPRTVQVSWELSQAQMTVLDAWFENTLRAGERHFVAEVGYEGGGRLFYDACWIAPYSAEPRASPQAVRWRVVGSLWLLGAGVVDRPLSGTLLAEYGLALTAAGVVVGETLLAAEYGLALTLLQSLSAEYGLALLVLERSFELREDGGRELREDGGYEMRE